MSRSLVGSSSSSTFGSPISSRSSCSRRRSPPDRSPTRVVSRSPVNPKSSSRLVAVTSFPEATWVTRRSRLTRSSTRSPAGSSLMACDRWPMSIVRPRLTRPESGARSPVSSRSRVVLPAPLMPIRPIRSPGPIDQERSSISVRSGMAYGHVGQVEHVLAEPGHGEPLQLQPVARRGLVLDQHVGRIDPELGLGGSGRGAAAQPGQLLAQQVLAPTGQLGGLPGPLGPRQHVRRVATVVGVHDAVVHLPDP